MVCGSAGRTAGTGGGVAYLTSFSLVALDGLEAFEGLAAAFRVSPFSFSDAFFTRLAGGVEGDGLALLIFAVTSFFFVFEVASSAPAWAIESATFSAATDPAAFCVLLLVARLADIVKYFVLIRNSLLILFIGCVSSFANLIQLQAV